MKDEPSKWNEEQQSTIKALVTTLMMSQVLRNFDHKRPAIIESNDSDDVSAGVWSQYGDEGVLYPVPYCSKKHTLAEWNYNIYDKVLMAIIKALEEWRL